MNRKSALKIACAATATAVLGASAVPVRAFDLAPGAQIFTGATNFGNFFDVVTNPDGVNAYVGNDNAFQVDDKIFHNFVFSVACLPGPCPNDDSTLNPVSPVNPNSITVAQSQGTSGPGLDFNDFWRANPGSEIDLRLGFDVHVVDPNKAINDVHLSFVGLEDLGQILIEESVRDLETGISLLPSGPLGVDNLSATTDITAQAWVDLIRPVKKLRVLKDIQLRGVDDIDPTQGEQARFTILTQEFSQVHTPEPGTIGGLLAMGSIGIGAMLKRQRQTSNK
ncbi:MAG: PEP-CTERM sorting domain-containing protein [Cyanobacteriota bacterium]|nr:PEP-CTERM sorting domain-containing protein [Cyanobacteriota bacterium]